MDKVFEDCDMNYKEKAGNGAILGIGIQMLPNTKELGLWLRNTEFVLWRSVHVNCAGRSIEDAIIESIHHCIALPYTDIKEVVIYEELFKSIEGLDFNKFKANVEEVLNDNKIHTIYALGHLDVHDFENIHVYANYQPDTGCLGLEVAHMEEAGGHWVLSKSEKGDDNVEEQLLKQFKYLKELVDPVDDEFRVKRVFISESSFMYKEGIRWEYLKLMIERIFYYVYVEIIFE